MKVPLRKEEFELTKGDKQMSKKKLQHAVRIVPVLLALLAWGIFPGIASAKSLVGGPSRTTQTTSTSAPTTTSTSGCTSIETIVSNILELFGASADFMGCSVSSTSSTTSTTSTTPSNSTSSTAPSTSSSTTSTTPAVVTTQSDCNEKTSTSALQKLEIYLSQILNLSGVTVAYECE